MRSRLTITLAVVLGLWAGGVGGPARAGHESSPYFDLDALPAPDYNGDQIFEGLKSFVNAYPYRLTGGPTELAAGQFLVDQTRALGYQSTIYTLTPDGATEACAPNVTCTAAGLKAVVAIKQGTTRPNEWITFLGHYDTVPNTIYGAYDNGAGTNFINYLAKEFANVQTNRSLAFVWFNGEEEGLLASELYADYLKNVRNQSITAALGFDMVGIAYPVATTTANNCLCMWYGAGLANRFVPLLRHVNFEYLGFPESLRQVWIQGQNSRNSDERSFANVGYPTMRWAGMRTAASYPAYHRETDTIEQIITSSGGETFYEAGIENTLKSVYYTALTLDNHVPVPQATSSASGRTVSFNGSGSTDEDGALSTYSWDFGDGTTGEGATVSHTYAAPGTYTATLTVADNLWSQVTRSTTMQVTVS